MTQMIQIKNVSVMRGANIVLRDINLEISADEHVAILGPNGSGKSTLIKTISRELYPLATEDCCFQLFGRDRWDVSSLRSLLGIVPSDTTPFCSRPISGRDAVLSGFFSSIGLWPHMHPTRAMHEKADEVLAMLDCAHLSERNVGELSAGEARRLMIARALVHNPQALLLDEPTNSLDVFAQRELRDAMRKLAISGIALLLITHHLPDIIPEIDRVIFMREGRIVSDGPKSDLLTDGALSQLFACKVETAIRDGYYHLL